MDPTYSDLYAFFGITKAEVEENERKLDKAYRSMCLTCHPDKGGDQETFAKVHNYYQILSSVVERRDYNEWYASSILRLHIGKMIENSRRERFLEMAKAVQVPANEYLVWHWPEKGELNYFKLGFSFFVYNQKTQVNCFYDKGVEFTTLTWEPHESGFKFVETVKKIYYPKTKETKAIDNQPIVTFLVNKKGEFIEVIDVQNADSIIDVSQIPAEMREQVIKTAKDTVMNFIKTKRQEEWMLLLQQWLSFIRDKRLVGVPLEHFGEKTIQIHYEFSKDPEIAKEDAIKKLKSNPKQKDVHFVCNQADSKHIYTSTMRHNLQPHYHEYLEFESSNVSAEHPQTKEIIDVTQFSGSFNGIYFQWNDNEKLSSMDWVLEMIVKADEMKEKLVPPEAKSTPSAETHEEKKKNLRKHSHDKDDHKDDHKDEHKDGHSSNCILQ